VTHRLPFPSVTHPPPQLQSRLVAAERAQHAAESRALHAKRDALNAEKAHDAERARWRAHHARVQSETELVKVKVDAVKAEHSANLRELVRRNEDLAAVGEALEREREARARCEERLRKAQKIERDALEKLAASEDSLELALATNAERAAKAARRARKSAMDASTGAGGWDEAYADVKEELDALRETLRRREADAAQLAQKADAAEARALAAENARHAADASALANEVKELRTRQSSMAHEVAKEVTARVVEEVGGDLHLHAGGSIAPTPTRASGNAPSKPPGIDPTHHALLVGQSHRNRAEIERLTRLYDERGEQLEALRSELRGESDARAEAEDKARAAEATTLRLMSLNKNLLDSYQKLLDDKANDAVGQGRAAAAAKEAAASSRRRMRRFEDGSDDDDFAGDFDGSLGGGHSGSGRRASHLPRVATLAHSRDGGGGGGGGRVSLGARGSQQKKTWNWNGPRGTPPPQPPRPSRLHFATPPTTTEKARGADGGADGGAAAAARATSSSLMPSVYHPSSSLPRTALPRTTQPRDDDVDDFEDELRRRAELAETEATANRAAADEAMAEVLDGLRGEMAAMDGEYASLLRSLRDAKANGKVPDASLRSNPVATPTTPSARELEQAAARAAWLMERMEEKGSQIAALTRTLERSKDGPVGDDDRGGGGGPRDSATSGTL